MFESLSNLAVLSSLQQRWRWAHSVFFQILKEILSMLYTKISLKSWMDVEFYKKKKNFSLIWETQLSLDVMYHIDDFPFLFIYSDCFSNAKPTSNFWDKPIELLMCIILFTCCHILLLAFRVGFCIPVWVRQAHHFLAHEVSYAGGLKGGSSTCSPGPRNLGPRTRRPPLRRNRAGRAPWRP